VVALLETDAARFSVPSKVLTYLCAGRPILLGAPDENLCVCVVREAGAGVAVTDNEAGHFLAAAANLRSDADRRACFGQAARRYAERNFGIAAKANAFLSAAMAASRVVGKAAFAETNA
jgi:hypothetical protein